MIKKWPFISVILPTHNEEKKLPACLKSLQEQAYPGRVELLVIDDDSTDKTVAIARFGGAKVFYHRAHNCEIGRSLGLKKAKGELVLIIDADNLLPSKNWLTKMVQPFLDHPDLVGSQTGWYQYEKKDASLNRYCALFGASKPMSFYLKKRNFLTATERNWPYPASLVKETRDYFLVRFNPENMPTLGSQGFLGKRKSLLKTHYQPYYYHMDSLHELVAQGQNLFAVVKLGIIHRQADSLVDFHQKFYRDASRFFQQRYLRRYVYQANLKTQLVAAFKMGTFIFPLLDSLKGFLKIKDWAWFWHPILCQTTFWLTLIAFWLSPVRGLRREKR